MPHPREGYVYATTGEDYTILARRSARTLKQVCPGACIDLFTDQDVVDPVFDRICRLDRSTHRPKLEAMGRSRFARTIMLDADTVPLTNISELFSMARVYPLSAMTGWSRPAFMLREQADIPRWYPHFNSGVMVFRRGRRVRQLARAWAADMDSSGRQFDQTSLRRLCWDLDISVGAIPQEYNLILLDLLKIWGPAMGAPRLLHIRDLHASPAGDPQSPFDLAQLLPPQQVTMIKTLFAAEASQGTAPPALPVWRRNRAGLAAIRLWKRLKL
ncbi:hypothetical protein ROE7235_02327 [Roseibaca ekhonensis]|jgi:hypothetical protein|uniref:Nucleotide-diphospho-sugar transferase domain-containing protein n=1 Tax=Roseinatronobacter ekhonensis TaxID=254356 RepID=A0A3B0MXN5_9RHOB|nr:putative nucleotide-diphospho-sugar transferase [Roseibaca ekhonensis]SUZ32566.1 hypothetical protein ROE7235_02327 [Roseibaca ekhonensis]